MSPNERRLKHGSVMMALWVIVIVSLIQGIIWFGPTTSLWDIIEILNDLQLKW